MATTITPTIVTVNTTVTTAPVPSQLQQSAALVSTGGTTLSTGAYKFIGKTSDLTAILVAPQTITSMAWASGTVTVTAVADLTLTTGETFTTTISGANPAAYNGTYVATVTGLDTFTFALATDPGTNTVPGTYTPNDSTFLSNAYADYLAQGTGVGVYVLELGSDSGAAAGIAALTTWIAASSPQVFYSYLLPRSWDNAESAAIATLAGLYSSPSGQTYFFVECSSEHLSAYAGIKSVIAVVPSPTATASEVQTAQLLYQWTANNPQASNPLAPLAYRYVYGATPWVQQGNSSAISTVLTAYGNLILTGAEGGVSNACIFKGTAMDGKQLAFWYGLDWFRIQVKRLIANAIINGSNSNPPLLYNQAGINTLQAIAQGAGNTTVGNGCALSVVVSAVDFASYTTANPSDYAAGIYNGLSATLVGTSGFLTITFNLDATTFAG